MSPAPAPPPLPPRYFETCTRFDRSRSLSSRRDDYWCPSEDSVDPSTLDWLGEHDAAGLEGTYGLCPDYLHPPDNGCEDHYEAVRRRTRRDSLIVVPCVVLNFDLLMAFVKSYAVSGQ